MDAAALLERTWGGGGEIFSGTSPGRVTLIGEHVDYAGGLVLAAAIDSFVTVSVRRSAASTFRIVSSGRTVERAETMPCGDIGDRILGAVEALRRAGHWTVPALDIAVEASLPESAGLASSAAVTCATLIAVLGLIGASVAASEIVEWALVAERDIAGIPCGPLDQLSVVFGRSGDVLLLNCLSIEVDARIPWRWDDAVLVVCSTAERHDNGGDGYRQRVEEAGEVLAAVGAMSAQETVDPAALAALPPPLDRRGRHVFTETNRVQRAAEVLRSGTAADLGDILSASHASLRDDYEVSTPLLDAVVAAATDAGALGARLVGAGFGGSVLALCSEADADAVGAAMTAAAGDGGVAWQLRPDAGAAWMNPGTVV